MRASIDISSNYTRVQISASSATPMMDLSYQRVADFPEFPKAILKHLSGDDLLLTQRVSGK